jgi:synaptonemal complex protein 3
MEDLEKCHRKQQADMQTEIKKEMALLQKKMLMESVRKEREREREREPGERGREREVGRDGG